MSLISASLYLYVFLQSAGIEAIFLRWTVPNRGSFFWLKSFLINSITHPIVVFFLLSDGRLKNLEGVLIAETFAIISETFLLAYAYRSLTLSKSFVLSLGANLLSWQLAPIFTWCAIQLAAR